MSFLNFFSSPISAIRSNSLAFQVIGENIANSVTTGFKAADTRFSELVSASSASIYQSLGGVRPVVQQFVDKPGIINGSNRSLDIAISGQGFLVTNTQLDGNGEYLLTRAGELSLMVVPNGIGEAAYLVDVGGNFLLGWPANPDGSFTPGTTVASLTPIRVDPGSASFAAIATTAAEISANLAAETPAGESYAMSLPVIDGTGTHHTLQMTFTKTATPDTWDVAFALDGGSVTSGGTVTMSFDAQGNIVAPTAHSVGLSFGGGGGATSVAIDFTWMTQFAGASTVRGFDQNGIPEGQLESVFFDEAGVLNGRFSNGQVRALYKLPLATVRSPNQLTPRNDTHFALTDNSGPLELFEADRTGIGSFVPSAVEMSTTDIGMEFAKLIQTQQSYTMAARTYSVIEEMVQTATRLKV